MTALFLERYLDSIETLPVELSKNFTALRELNKKTAVLMGLTEKLRLDLLYNLTLLSKDEIKKKRQDLKRLKELTFTVADEKITLANQTYEMVDQHIQGLDSELSRYDLKKKEEVPETEAPKNFTSKKKKRRSTKIPKKKENPGDASSLQNEIDPNAKPPNTEVLNMPIDPNEPTYCVCQQVSYGEMVACDNQDCLVEWFHFACVNLKENPKGTWLCPDCKSQKKQ